MRLGLAMFGLLLLAGCATQIPGTIAEGEDVPGFFSGIWHGMVFPLAWFFSLFADPDGVAIYAVPNTGPGYNFGYFIGVTLLGGGTMRWLDDSPKQ